MKGCWDTERGFFLEKLKELFEMFFIFARIGGFTFGGGYAMLPMLQKELVENRDWTTEKELIDYFAIGQCTPGIIAVNTATFVGYKKSGVLGAIFATAGMVFPSIVIVSIIAAFLQNFSEITFVQHAFAAIRVAVGVLIVNAVIKMGKTTIKDKLCLVLAIVSFLVMVMFSFSPVWVVIAAAVLGIVIPVIKGAKA